MNVAESRLAELATLGRAFNQMAEQVKKSFDTVKASELKLIDTVGTFDDALAKAKEFAGMPAGTEAKIEELPEQPGLFESLLAGRVTAAFSPNPAHALAPIVRTFRSMLSGYSHFRAAYCPVVPVM